MKMQRLFLVALVYFMVFSACQKENTEIGSDKTKTDSSLTFRAESVADLQRYYSGRTTYNSTTKTLTFKSSGTIKFPTKSGEAIGSESRWDVPTDVAVIAIDSNVTVSGQFWCSGVRNLLIKGQSKKKSIIFGSNDQNFGTGSARDYVTFLAYAGTKLTVQNLTSLNPKGFHSRAETNSQGSSMALKDCRFIDNRAGTDNNSDGSHNAFLIENCYFSTGDDAICNYNQINQTIKNCTVNLIENAIPIQFGYNGPTSGNTTLTISKLIITGNLGRSASLIQCRNRGTLTNTPRATKTINIDGLYFRPSVNGVAVGHVIRADDNSCAYAGTWKNVNMNIANYYQNAKPTSNIKICDSTSKTTKSFSCGTPPKFSDALN